MAEQNNPVLDEAARRYLMDYGGGRKPRQLDDALSVIPGPHGYGIDEVTFWNGAYAGQIGLGPYPAKVYSSRRGDTPKDWTEIESTEIVSVAHEYMQPHPDLGTMLTTDTYGDPRGLLGFAWAMHNGDFAISEE